VSIELLSPEVIARIAAGEVIERPASVVKELIENSLDAGSSQIGIEIEGGGIDSIRISDNGCGIARDELELAFQRHATSKITCFEDMFALHSLGFRGEALPSIAAVAEVEISSCTAGCNQGNYINLKDGKMVKKEAVGKQQGTSITVHYLFRNVPARLKFLKSTATEASHIAQMTSQYAMAYPEVKFSLSLGERVSLSTPGKGQLLDAIIQVYGLEIGRHMLEISKEEYQTNPEISISGMVSTPSVSRSNSSYISLFVNRRWINSRRLNWAVEEAYHGLLVTGRHPIAIINISVAPDDIDVNIHPTKSEVKFKNEPAVFSVLQRAIRQTLVKMAPVPVIADTTTPAYHSTQKQFSLDMTYTSRHAQQAVKEKSIPVTTTVATLPALRVLGQLRNSYIVAEGPDGLYLIDQHAAHERVQFEKLTRERLQQKPEIQALLEPAILEIKPQQAMLFQHYCDELASFGFSFEIFGSSSWLVRSIPAVLAGKDWRDIFNELLDSPLSGSAAFIDKLLALVACHSAVRFGQTMDMDQMRALVRQLEQVSEPQSCPHGRPVLVCLTDERLGKEFKRT
jgi:DNA mismatch repair protein MutL